MSRALILELAAHGIELDVEYAPEFEEQFALVARNFYAVLSPERAVVLEQRIQKHKLELGRFLLCEGGGDTEALRGEIAA